jgi:hypothetical protein
MVNKVQVVVDIEQLFMVVIIVIFFKWACLGATGQSIHYQPLLPSLVDSMLWPVVIAALKVHICSLVNFGA